MHITSDTIYAHKVFYILKTTVHKFWVWKKNSNHKTKSQNQIPFMYTTPDPIYVLNTRYHLCTQHEIKFMHITSDKIYAHKVFYILKTTVHKFWVWKKNSKEKVFK